jgi:hypothetical protein
MSQPSNIEAPAFYLNSQRKVAVINYSQQYVSDIFSLLNTPELVKIVQLFLKQRRHVQPQNSFEDLDAADYLATIKAVILDDPTAFD